MSPNFYIFDPNLMPSLFIIDSAGNEYIYGDKNKVYELASITKLFSAITICETAAAGFIDLDEVVKDSRFNYEETYLKDLISHAGGISFKGEIPQIKPRTKRIYSNLGFEIAGNYLSNKISKEFGETTFIDIFNQGLKTILTRQQDSILDLYGSCAFASRGNLLAIGQLLREMREPTFIDGQAHKTMITTYLEGLSGVIPGWGRSENCGFGYGYEIKEDKFPHWMGTKSSAQTFGHFGCFVLHDPIENISIAALGDKPFELWAKKAWPVYVDEIFETFS